jgi:hypothetical protein
MLEASRPPLLVPACLCAALLGGVACSGDEQSTRPATTATTGERPAGVDANARRQPSFRLFSAWLDALNSGDRRRYRTFIERKFPSALPRLGQDLEIRALTGGLDLRKLTSASATHITGRVQERDSDQFGEFELELAAASGKPGAAKPYRIVSLGVRAIPRPAEFPIERLTEEEALAASRRFCARTRRRTASAAPRSSPRTATSSSPRPTGARIASDSSRTRCTPAFASVR